MNYRHAFHAGNFADLLKHAALMALLAEMVRGREPVHVLDTHAGAGLYDLGGDMARRSREAEAGIVRLMADDGAPAAFASLKAAVRRLNPKGDVRAYPGSPVLTAGALRRGDSYLGCELRADDVALLRAALKGQGAGDARPVQADGFEEAARWRGRGRALVLIDPPFERGDDYARSADATGAILSRDPRATVAIWLPLKDLDTFDRFVTDIEALSPPATLVVECRLDRLDNPLKMNGCALVVVGRPEGLEAPLLDAAQWIVGAAGTPAGEARRWSVGA